MMRRRLVMSEQVYDELEMDAPSDTPSATNGELVHWMEPKPLRMGPGGVSAVAAGAVVLGVALAVTVLALAHWLGPNRTLKGPALVDDDELDWDGM
jgi:hypothetical protein